MNTELFPQIETLINKLIEKNQNLNDQVTQLNIQLKDLTESNRKLMDENETLQLEILESDEKHKETSHTLSGLLGKLQKVTQVD